MTYWQLFSYRGKNYLSLNHTRSFLPFIRQIATKPEKLKKKKSCWAIKSISHSLLLLAHLQMGRKSSYSIQKNLHFSPPAHSKSMQKTTAHLAEIYHVTIWSISLSLSHNHMLIPQQKGSCTGMVLGIIKVL